MLANVCVCTWARVCKGEKRERDLECNGRSRCCSIQGGKAKLTVSQTPSPFSLSGPYLPPSTSTLPFSSLSQHLSSCLHLCRAHFRWQEGGVEGGGGSKGKEGTGMIAVVVAVVVVVEEVMVRVGVWGGCKRGRETKGCTMIAQQFKSWWGGTFQPRWGCFPLLLPSSFLFPPPALKNPHCNTSKSRRLTARHSNLCNRTVL